MDKDTSLMESEFLPPAADLEQLIGTLLHAINAQVEADESCAELSLAAWQQWLDEEGYPIQEAIEQFCKHVSLSHQAELNTLKSELLARLHDPSGLSVLSDVIDAQQPEIAENLHAFIERATAKAQETYAIAGGTHTKAIVGGSVAGLLLVGGIVYKRRNARIERELSELGNTAAKAFEKTELNIINETHREAQDTLRMVDRRSQELTELTPGQLRAARNIALAENPGIHNIKIELKKNLKEFTDNEITLQVKKCSDVFAKESVGYMERHEKEGFKVMIDYLQLYNFAESVKKSGNQVLLKFDEFASPSRLTILREGREMAVNYKPANFNDAISEEQAKETMQRFFADRYKEILKVSFDRAYKNGDKQIDLAFHDVYVKALKDIESQCARMEVEGEAVAMKIRSALGGEADRGRQYSEEWLRRTGQDVETDVEDSFQFT